MVFHEINLLYFFVFEYYINQVIAVDIVRKPEQIINWITHKNNGHTTSHMD